MNRKNKGDRNCYKTHTIRTVACILASTVRRNRYMGSAMAVNEAVRINRHDHEPNFNKVREKQK